MTGGFETSEPTPNDAFPPSKPSIILSLPKHHHHCGPSIQMQENIRDNSFKLPHTQGNMGHEWIPAFLIQMASYSCGLVLITAVKKFYLSRFSYMSPSAFHHELRQYETLTKNQVGIITTFLDIITQSQLFFYSNTKRPRKHPNEDNE